MVAVTKKAPRRKATTRNLAKVEKTELAQQQPVTPVALSPIEMIQQLKSAGLEVSDMKEMLALQKEYEENEAKKAFNLALAEFKAEDIMITRDANVSYENNDGSVTSYNHATLGSIVAIAVPFLSSHGFSHRWDTKQLDGGIVNVTFVLTHRLGHSERTSLQAGLDQSGGKNNIQALASTVSYLERYTMLAGTGLAVSDQDDDGQTAEPVLLIDMDQEIVLNDLVKETDTNLADFLAYCKTDSIANLPAHQYDKAKRTLESKLK